MLLMSLQPQSELLHNVEGPSFIMVMGCLLQIGNQSNDGLFYGS